jgi:ADP-heptose:LPS heptosyltransferase
LNNVRPPLAEKVSKNRRLTRARLESTSIEQATPPLADARGSVATSLTTHILAQLPPQSAIILIRLRSLGDTVLTTPALVLLHKARPDLRLIPVLERPFDALLEGNPAVSRILSVSRSAGTWQKWKLLEAIRREQPQLCLNLHGGSTSAWLTALSGARFRAGFGHFQQRFAYNVLIPRAQEILNRGPDDPVHTAEHLASAVFHLGVPVSGIPRAQLSAGASPIEDARPYAVLHVTAAYFTKQWASSKFWQTAEFLRRKGLEPVILAGPGEDGVFADFPGMKCFAGRPLSWVMSLIAGASLFVGNDSGPAHIAAAFGVPVVVIFGSSNSQVWRPWKTAHEVVETAWDCKPCPGDRCYAFEEPRCILSVEFEAVCAAIERLMPEMPHNQEHGPNRLVPAG